MIGSIDEQLNGCPFKATLQESRQDSRININSIFESEPERQNCFQLPFCFQAIIIFVVVATMVLGGVGAVLTAENWNCRKSL